MPTPEAIELRVTGADLLLVGRFLHWMPVTLISGKDNEGMAQLLFDVTSNRTVRGEPVASLFEFKTTSVKAVGPQAYRLKGTLKADTGAAIESGEIDAVLESPRDHTPFFAMTFTLDRTKFASLWTAFEDKAAVAIAKGQEELRPWAWLREPLLAAA
ncbi:MAG TPA: hypothetical protein VGG33_27865 [Polyangia bacterium]